MRYIVVRCIPNINITSAGAVDREFLYIETLPELSQGLPELRQSLPELPGPVPGCPRPYIFLPNSPSTVPLEAAAMLPDPGGTATGIYIFCILVMAAVN